MTITEAAKVLGTTTEEVKRLQKAGNLPDPIPDDYLDPIVKFRIELEQAHRRRIDRSNQGGPSASE